MATINYLPEMAYHFNNYWKTNKELDMNNLPIPDVEDSTSFRPPGSIFRLLFNSTMDSSTGYNYLFKEVLFNTLSQPTQRRFHTTGKYLNCYVTDATGTLDILNIEDENDDNITMLDLLYEYRLGNTISLEDIDYDDLGTNLSKLVYIYLNLMISGIYQPFDEIDTVADEESILENLFELYIINESHRLIRTLKEFIESDLIQLRPIRQKFTVDTDILESGSITITDTLLLPYDTDSIFVHKNGNLLDSSLYSIESDSSSLVISGLDSTGVYGVNLLEDDIIIIDYEITTT